MSTERPNDRLAADAFQLWLVKLDQEGYLQHPTMRALYKRLGTAFSDVHENMSTNLATELADLTFKKMMSMTLHLDIV
jgi:hypothetical protein